MSPVIYILIAVVLVIALFVISVYNSLVKGRTLVDEAWSGIDIQLKKRYDLIPNLVETVKAYAKHESKTFEEIARLRSSAMKEDNLEKKAELEGQLTQSIRSIMAVAENYPELKANENFSQLQTTLETIETELEGARRYYNGTVRDYNMTLVVFPSNIVAGLFGFKERAFFETEEESRQNVKVDFSDKEEK